MSKRIVPRLAAAAVLATLWASMVAIPVAAASTVRWVDDNGGATGPVACDTAGFTTIQAAIDASSAGDVVKVCPGTYHEQLVIDVEGLTVMAVPARFATIVAPSTLDAGPALVEITADSVALRGFRLALPAGDMTVAVQTVASCSPYEAAVISYASSTRIIDNSIFATGDYTLNGSCGYDYGIILDGQATVALDIVYPPGTSRVARNVVRDFHMVGILVHGSAMARVDHNRVRFLHESDTTNQSASGAGVATVNGYPTGRFGIVVDDGAFGDVHRNDVGGFYEVYGRPYLGSGIYLEDADPASLVRGNKAHDVGTGVTLGYYSSAGGWEAFNNVTWNTGIGLYVGGNENNVHHNRLHLGRWGLAVYGNGNNLWLNDALNNSERDCLDGGTANSWTANAGSGNSLPSDICELPPF